MAEVHIGLVGVGWMGQAHAKACRAVPIVALLRCTVT